MKINRGMQGILFTAFSGLLFYSSLYLNNNMGDVLASSDSEIHTKIALKKEEVRVNKVKTSSVDKTADVNYTVNVAKDDSGSKVSLIHNLDELIASEEVSTKESKQTNTVKADSTKTATKTSIKEGATPTVNNVAKEDSKTEDSKTEDSKTEDSKTEDSSVKADDVKTKDSATKTDNSNTVKEETVSSNEDAKAEDSAKEVQVASSDIASAKAIKEADYKGESYLLLVNKENVKIGWVKKAEVEVALTEKEEDTKKEDTKAEDSVKEDSKDTSVKEDVKTEDSTKEAIYTEKEEDISNYVKIKDNAKVYTEANSESKLVEKVDKLYTKASKKITLSDDSVWLKVTDGYIKVENSEDVSNKLVEIPADGQKIEDVAKKVERSVDELKQMNLGLGRNDVAPNVYVINEAKIDFKAEDYTEDKDAIALINFAVQYKDYIKEHKLLPSVVIAQALLESTRGTSGLATKDNNLFGIKADGRWEGAKSNWQTTEYNSWGGSYQTYSYFRSYASLADSIKDYVSFFEKNSRYSNVFGKENYMDALNEISRAGYATDPNYPTLVGSQVEKYGLAKLDK